MKNIIKNIAMAILIFCGFNAFSQAASGSSSSCSANCPFSSCEAKCSANMGAAICGCPWGFAACGCGGYSPSSHAVSNQQRGNLDLMVAHLNTFVSVEGINLKNKMIELRNLSLNPEANLDPVIDQIVNLCTLLNPFEKNSYNTFLSTINH